MPQPWSMAAYRSRSPTKRGGGAGTGSGQAPLLGRPACPLLLGAGSLLAATEQQPASSSESSGLLRRALGAGLAAPVEAEQAEEVKVASA
jgi:hypothetical protein